ncbi:MAG: hypothetical protein ABJF01_17835 [bacterium]
MDRQDEKRPPRDASRNTADTADNAVSAAKKPWVKPVVVELDVAAVTRSAFQGIGPDFGIYS